ANVLDGLIKASNCVVVRDIVVKQADAQTGEETTAMPVYTMPIPSQGPGSAMNRYRMSPEMMRRYGLGGMRGMQPTPATPPPPTLGPGVLQDEHLLETTLSLDTVKLKPAGKLAKAAAPPAALPTGPTAIPPEPGTETATQ